jgi:WXXGXW repeat (2 copies)
MTLRSSSLGWLVGAVLLAGCSTANPYPPVPAPLAETMPNPPVSAQELSWQPGHWDWSGSGYVWQPGQYVSSAGHTNMWMPGFWAKTDGGWAWQRAHWQ